MAVTETTEVHEPGWAERVGSSFKAVIVGVGLFAGAFPLLFWNEGRAVETAKRLDEGAGSVVSVKADAIDAANDGKLVHVSGKAVAGGKVKDDVFGIEAAALKLKRKVEIYQWQEDRKVRREKQGDKTVEHTTYTYKKVWCNAPIDSSAFKDSGHVNPSLEMAYGNTEFLAPDVKLGAFSLGDAHVKRIGGYKAFSFPQDYKVPEAVKNATAENGTIYVAYQGATLAGQPVTAGASPLQAAAQAAAGGVSNAVANAAAAVARSVSGAPAPGDLRIRFEVAEPHEISIVERQNGDTLIPWPASDGKTISLLKDGLHTAEAMFAAAKSQNSMLTWILRIAGFFIMLTGLKMVLGPISAIVDSIPVVGAIVSAITGFAAFLVAAALSLLTIGVAWVFHRPVLGVTIIAVAAGCAVLAFLAKKKKAVPAPAA